MEEVAVGEYVRTKDGFIRKVTQVNKKGSYEGLCYGAYSVDERYKNSVGISAKKIKKHSFNLVDLIEEEDYVNGSKVVDICESQYGGEKIIYIGGFGIPRKIYDNMIKSIVTHEQFASVEYKIKEN